MVELLARALGNADDCQRLRPQDDPISPGRSPSDREQGPVAHVGVVSTLSATIGSTTRTIYLPTMAGKVMSGGSVIAMPAWRLPCGRGRVDTFVVADGMGGQLAGEKASQMAVDIIPKELSRRIGSAESDDHQIQKTIKDAVAAANQEILGLSVIQTEFNNMGTTVVLALFRNDRVYVAGIGDSRAYRFRDGRIEQLTKDHPAQAPRGGTITAEELPNRCSIHVLYFVSREQGRSGWP